MFRALRGLTMAQKRTLLASKPEYAWLAELGITENTPGVYNGTWAAGEGEGQGFTTLLIADALS